MLTGIIIPGPKLRERIDKAAQLVAKDASLIERVKKSPRAADFPYFVETNEFYPYFVHMLQEYRKPQAKPEAATKAEEKTDTAATSGAARTVAESGPSTPSPPPEPEAERRLRDPCPESFTMVADAGVTLKALDVDVMRLTAQHVAVYGPEFFEALLRKVSRLPQYDFLQDADPRHATYESLVGAYTLLLKCDAKTMTELEANQDALHVRSLCEEKRAFVKAEEARRRAALLTEPELRRRLNWDEFSVLGAFSLEDLKLTPKNAPPPKDRMQQLPTLPAQLVVADYSAEGVRRSYEGADVVLDPETKRAIRLGDGGEPIQIDALAAANIRSQEERERTAKRLRKEDTGLADDEDAAQPR